MKWIPPIFQLLEGFIYCDDYWIVDDKDEGDKIVKDGRPAAPTNGARNPVQSLF